MDCNIKVSYIIALENIIDIDIFFYQLRIMLYSCAFYRSTVIRSGHSVYILLVCMLVYFCLYLFIISVDYWLISSFYVN